jgi:hypothetical protein
MLKHAHLAIGVTKSLFDWEALFCKIRTSIMEGV